MPALIRPAHREVRTFAFDSRRWADYRPRADDIIIATYPKCGTTWMQRIVAMLVFGSAAPRPLAEVSPWIDARFREPATAVLARIEAQTHRRILKSHLPLDALPLHAGVRLIHVARDGRDACMSFHNHCLAMTPTALETFDRIGLEDPAISRPYPRPAADARGFFLDWLAGPAAATPGANLDFFGFERTFWAERARPELLLVHFDDLLADLPGELRGIAGFLGIACAPGLLAELAAAAEFTAMRRDGEALLPAHAGHFQGGADRFLFKGTNGRWRDVLRPEDIAAYEARAAASLPADCARWLARGWLAADASLSAPAARPAGRA